MDLRKCWPTLIAGHRSISHCRISCESYSETMTLLLFGGPSYWESWRGIKAGRECHACRRILHDSGRPTLGEPIHFLVVKRFSFAETRFHHDSFSG
jgi:hypothetical protein